MSRRDRSRSRLGLTSGMISRLIVGFGRYPGKRPPGLQVNANGEFHLDNLMNVWGLARGLTEEDVLNAIHENMFHDESTALRFAINTDSQGNVMVCVKPSRRTGGACNGQGKSSGRPNPRSYCSKLHGEQIQRWLAWMLRKGCSDYGLRVTSEGWVNVKELAGTMRQSRPDFGEFDAEKLQEVIEMSDVAGRFEFQAGSLRKVPKGSRRQRNMPAWVGLNHQQLPGMRGRSQSLSSAPPVQSRSPEQGGCLPIPMKVEGSRLEENPAPPPGKHWTKYQDDGQIWWHYKGPLGQWWCATENTTPQRYHEDA